MTEPVKRKKRKKKKTNNAAYWANRIKRERQWQAQAVKDTEAFNEHLKSLYEQTISAINQEIYQYLGISSNAEYKKIKQADFDQIARSIGEQVTQAEQAGTPLPNIKQELNKRLKIYKANMFIGRDEVLKSMIGAQIVKLGFKQQEKISNKLKTAYIEEKHRQAGILDVTTQSTVWTKPKVMKSIYKQVNGADFSKRIWADVDTLKGTLDGQISQAIIRGQNPREMAKKLTSQVNQDIDNTRYATERIARTEMARTQTEAAKDVYKEHNAKYVLWIAEAQACQECRKIADKDNGYGQGIYLLDDVPDLPVHPNCRCSIGAYHPR